MKHKVLALVLCLAMLLTMTLPGTLAVSVDAEDTTSTFTAENEETGKEEQNIAPASLTDDGENKQDENKQEETPTENSEEKNEEGKSEGDGEENENNNDEQKNEEENDDTDDLNGDNSENAETVTLPECSCPEGYQKNTDYDHDTDCARNLGRLHELTNEQLALLWPTLTDTERACILKFAGVNGFSEEQVAYIQQLEEGKDSTEEEEPEEEVITDTVVTVTNGVPDCAPPFSSAGPLIKYATPSQRSLAATYALARNVTTVDVDDAGGALTSGLELNKTAQANTDGSYTITLEAYATGESVTTYVKDGVDIVLMLDLSNYMGKATTPTSYIYTSVAAKTQLSKLSTAADTYWYKDGDDYYAVAVTQQTTSGSWPWMGGSTTYTITYTKNGIDKTLVDQKSGSTSLDQAGENNSSVTLYTRNETTGETTYDINNTEKLNALKTAVNNFIVKVNQQAPASRIAIVTYAGTATVKSGSQAATDGALVTVNDSGVTALKSIVDNLSIQGGASNSHYAAADAVKIFQSVPTDSAEYSRQRVAILFSAGIPANGWAIASPDKQLKTSGQSVAQATMHLSTILKTAKGEQASLKTGGYYDDGSNFDGGAYWYDSEIKGLLGGSEEWKTGCGSNFYCVGLDIPSSGDQSARLWENPAMQGALANEYFWRISNHRPDGSHIQNVSDLGTSAQSWYDSSVYKTVNCKIKLNT